MSTSLRRLSERIMAYAGLVLPDWVLGARMRERMRALGLASEAEYVALVLSPRGAGELEHLLEVVRVGETRFFRHEAHVQALIDTVVPAVRARRSGGIVRAWSAGCASGEEAYTLAMVLGELLPRPQYQVRVLATDVSARAVELAVRGEYPADAVARVPEPFRERAFVPVGEPSNPDGPKNGLARPARYRIAPRLARCVQFERRNLLEGPYPADIDIIWCRNVFIYFAPDARVHVAKKLARSLSRDGVLFIGYSENLRDIAELEAVHTPHAVVYKKRVSDVQGARPAGSRAEHEHEHQSRPSVLVAPPAHARGRGEHRSKNAPARRPGEVTLRLGGRYDDGGRLSTELGALMADAPARVVVDLDGAELLDDRCASILRRARSAARATDIDFAMRASRPGITRWLRRHGLIEPADTERGGGA